MIAAHPLQWPTGWPRTTARKTARFSSKSHSRYLQSLTINDGVQRVLNELDRMGYGREDIVISTNVPTRLDGLPRSDRGEPGDPGVAVYWQTRKGEKKVMAIDIYDRVADNLAAVAATLDAMRAIERHGGAQILDRAFTGFTALPAPGARRTWREVMGFVPGEPVDLETLRIRYRKLASTRHPDRDGGSDAAMAELNGAYTKAQGEIQ